MLELAEIVLSHSEIPMTVYVLQTGNEVLGFSPRSVHRALPAAIMRSINEWHTVPMFVETGFWRGKSDDGVIVEIYEMRLDP